MELSIYFFKKQEKHLEHYWAHDKYSINVG